MKRSILLVFIVACGCSKSFAQKKLNLDPIKTDVFINAKPRTDVKEFGSYAVLKGQDFVNCSYYLNDAKVKNAAIIYYKDDFYEENMDKSIKEIHEAFFKEANIKLSKKQLPILTNIEPAPYCLKIHVYKAVDDGKHWAYVLLIDNATGEVLCQHMHKANGGMFGSMVNLMGDASEKIAGEIANDIKRDFNKVVKQKEQKK